MDIYYKDNLGGLFVNLFIPSVLTWKEKGIAWQMDTKYPEDKVINLSVKQLAHPLQMPLHIRYPKWAFDGAFITVNGKAISVAAKPGTYITINRKWHKGDHVQITYPMSLYTESMPDNANQKAVLYGPLVLSGELGTGQIRQRDIPVFVSAKANLNDWIKPDDKQPNLFYASNNGKKVMLEPLYKVYNQKQAVYWDFFTVDEWKLKEQQFEAERKAEEELNARTLDVMRLGEMQPEREHDLKGEQTNTGSVNGMRWRDATNGGWFSFTMNTKNAQAAELQCSYIGKDGEGREFEILVDGQKIATEKLSVKTAPGIYALNYAIPAGLLNGKQYITVKFQALPGKTAGGVFGCRLYKQKSP